MQRKVTFNNKLLPYLLVAPQVAITLVFFFWPAGQAMHMSLVRQDPFGLSTEFAGLENFAAVLGDPSYRQSLWTTVVFSIGVTTLALGPGLLLAVMADRMVKGAAFARSILILPYAVAPAVAGLVWLFLFNPTVGIVAYWLRTAGIAWDPLLNGNHAMVLVIIASAWKQISYNFLFFLAGLQSIPRSVIEAAKIDGAGESYRFWTIVFPLLSPTTFFLVVVNVVYTFFDTFSVIHGVTHGGPAKATEILVYKVYYDGVIALDLGASSAQSVILMAIVVGLTAIQFRYIERKVHY